jgi:hypothetical protein
MAHEPLAYLSNSDPHTVSASAGEAMRLRGPNKRAHGLRGPFPYMGNGTLPPARPLDI